MWPWRGGVPSLISPGIAGEGGCCPPSGDRHNGCDETWPAGRRGGDVLPRERSARPGRMRRPARSGWWCPSPPAARPTARRAPSPRSWRRSSARTIVVENRTGTRASSAAARSPRRRAMARAAEGRVPHLVNPALLKGLPFDYASFVPVSLVVSFPGVLAVKADFPRPAALPSSSARRRSGQGTISVGTQGNATARRGLRPVRKFTRRAGIEVIHRLAGGADAARDLAAGAIDAVLVATVSAGRSSTAAGRASWRWRGAGARAEPARCPDPGRERLSRLQIPNESAALFQTSQAAGADRRPVACGAGRGVGELQMGPAPPGADRRGAGRRRRRPDSPTFSPREPGAGGDPGQGSRHPPGLKACERMPVEHHACRKPPIKSNGHSFASYDDRFKGADATHALRPTGPPRGHAAGSSG